MSGPTSPWWRHDSNLSNDHRFAKLKARLGSDPYGMICRLYDFAASSQQDGNISQVDPDVLAARLDFKKRPKQLRKLLEESGYVDANGYIVDWKENLFRLFSSIREQNRERGKKSAQARAAKVTDSNETEENRTEQREENITATVQRPVERPVERTAVAPAPLWPEVLPEELLTKFAAATRRSPAFVALNYPAFRDRKVKFRDAFDEAGACDFREWLRNGKGLASQGNPASPASSPPEPAGWREAFPEFVNRHKPWDQLGRDEQRYITNNIERSLAGY